MIKLIFLYIFCLSIYASESITPIPLDFEYDRQKAELGKKLFFDPLLSKDGTISCSSCHQLPGNGADSTAYSYGVDAKEGNINSPTVLNAVFNFSQFWDGRAKDLKSQTLGPITNPIEMATTIEDVLKKIK